MPRSVRRFSIPCVQWQGRSYWKGRQRSWCQRVRKLQVALACACLSTHVQPTIRELFVLKSLALCGAAAPLACLSETFDTCKNAGFVQSYGCKQLCLVAMVDELIRQTEAKQTWAT